MTVPRRPGGLLIRSQVPDNDGITVRVTPEFAGWRHVGFEVFSLRQGQQIQGQSPGEETCVVLLGGRCRAWAGTDEWPDVGGRENPFDGPPHALYLPVGTPYMLEATTASVELAIGTGPVHPPSTSQTPRLINPRDVRVTTRGSGTMERTIHDILMEDQPADTLLVTEVLTPAGHWSSYPPHKHDVEDLPREAYLEELYYHRLRQADGWAMQRIYTRDGTLDETMSVHDGDCVLVPRGYHPVSAAPGFDLYYLNFMAGPIRQWRATYDPDVARALELSNA